MIGFGFFHASTANYEIALLLRGFLITKRVRKRVNGFFFFKRKKKKKKERKKHVDNPFSFVNLFPAHNNLTPVGARDPRIWSEPRELDPMIRFAHGVVKARYSKKQTIMAVHALTV